MSFRSSEQNDIKRHTVYSLMFYNNLLATLNMSNSCFNKFIIIIGKFIPWAFGTI